MNLPIGVFTGLHTANQEIGAPRTVRRVGHRAGPICGINIKTKQLGWFILRWGIIHLTNYMIMIGYFHA
jgi:hypothetical protein